MHGLMGAVAACVSAQGADQVLGVLAAELRHAVVGEGVLVVRHAMAAVAGVSEHFASLGIAFRARVHRRAQSRDESNGEPDCHPSRSQVHTRSAPAFSLGA